jgi:hypothetical protein
VEARREVRHLKVALLLGAALFAGEAAHGWRQYEREHPEFDEEDDGDLEDMA